MNKLLPLALGLFFVTSCSSDESTPDDEVNEIAEQFLETHNVYRAEVGIENLTWSDDLAQSATEWAEELAKTCAFEHSTGSYGENLWKGTSGAFSINQVVDAWGSEKEDYSYTNNRCAVGADCGHYTQIVWEETTEVGCGTATCDGWDIWVCQYTPAGNIIGQKPY